ncbi:MAG: LamG domain-containing protein, partial [Gemmatimonadales bacterium]
GDYGVSLAGGRIAFGVNNGSSSTTVCGSNPVADNRWHHVAVVRSASGQLSIFVDGRLDETAPGPTGDLSYRDGRSTSYPNRDPFLVIGAEKHDAGPAYPSYSGFLDEIRLSNIPRYTGPFSPPGGPFTSDGSTVALYHFDEGRGDSLGDSSGASGGPSDGVRRYGGDPYNGPEWFTSDLDFLTPRIYLPLIAR